jgi:hypothetical protein
LDIKNGAWAPFFVYMLPGQVPARSVFTIAAAELVDLAGGVDDFLLAGVEGVTAGADFDVQIFTGGGAGFERVAATASHADFCISGMDIRFHGWFLWIMPLRGAHDTENPARRQVSDFVDNFVDETAAVTGNIGACGTPGWKAGHLAIFYLYNQ